MKLMDLVEEKWSGKVKPKKHPPEGKFASGSANEIAEWAKSSHKDVKSAIDAINFYKNRAGKNLTANRRGVMERAIKILQQEEE